MAPSCRLSWRRLQGLLALPSPPSPGSPQTPTPGPWTASSCGAGGCSSPPCWRQDRPKSAATSRRGRGTASQGWVLLLCCTGALRWDLVHIPASHQPPGAVCGSRASPASAGGHLKAPVLGWAPAGTWHPVPALPSLCPRVGLHHPQQRAVDPPASAPGHHQRPRPCRAHPAPAGESVPSAPW